MGFRTFAGLWHSDVNDLPHLMPPDLHSSIGCDAYQTTLPWIDDLVRLWETYLLDGGFPVSVAAARVGQPVPRWFVEALFDVIHRDAFRASSLDTTQASSLLSRLWASITTPANLSAIASAVGVTQPTVARHINYLRDSYLLWRCPQLDREWVPKDRAADKLYPIDPLVARLGHLRNDARHDIDPTAVVGARSHGQSMHPHTAVCLLPGQFSTSLLMIARHGLCPLPYSLCSSTERFRNGFLEFQDVLLSTVRHGKPLDPTGSLVG
jgi:hypothetical protein